MAYIGTSPENTCLAIDGFLDEMRRIRTELVSLEELALSQNYLTGSYLFHFETNTQLARYLIHAERFQLDNDFLQRYPRIIQEVTSDDISRVARRYLDPENYYVAMVGP
jgi:zinc protease